MYSTVITIVSSMRVLLKPDIELPRKRILDGEGNKVMTFHSQFQTHNSVTSKNVLEILFHLFYLKDMFTVDI